MNYICVYCGESHNSRNETGSDVSCCGEVGHSMAERVNVPYREFCRHPEKCAGLGSCPRDPCCAD